MGHNKPGRVMGTTKALLVSIKTRKLVKPTPLTPPLFQVKMADSKRTDNANPSTAATAAAAAGTAARVTLLKRKASGDGLDSNAKRRRQQGTSSSSRSTNVQSALDLALAATAALGNVAGVRKLLTAGADPVAATIMSPDGKGPLYTAAAMGHTDVVQALTEHEYGLALQNQSGPLGAYPQHIAADNGHLEILKILCGVPGAPVDQTTRDGRTPAYMAAQSGHADCVQFLVYKARADPLRHDKNLVTPLAIAAQLRRISVVRVLLPALTDSSARINLETQRRMLAATDCAGFTPFHTACWTGDVKTVGHFVSSPAFTPALRMRVSAAPHYITPVELSKEHGDRVLVAVASGTLQFFANSVRLSSPDDIVVTGGWSPFAIWE